MKNPILRFSRRAACSHFLASGLLWCALAGLSPSYTLAGPDTVDTQKTERAQEDIARRAEESKREQAEVNKRQAEESINKETQLNQEKALNKETQLNHEKTLNKESDANSTDPAAQEKSSGGRRRLKSHPDADGDHSMYKTDPRTGEISRYETYRDQRGHEHDPKPFRTEKSVDMTGASHKNSITGEEVPVPHVQGRDVEGGVRPAEAHELPNGGR